MRHVIKPLGLALILCSAVLLLGCQRCAGEKPANVQTPAAPAAKASDAKTLTLPDAEDTILYGFGKDQRYAAIRLIEKDGADLRVKVQALYLGSGALSDQGKFLSDVSTKEIRAKEPGLSLSEAKHSAIVMANELAKSELMRLGFSNPLNPGKKLVDNVALNAADKGPWATNITAKLSLPDGQTGGLVGSVITRPIASPAPNGPRQESALGLFMAIEMPAPAGIEGTMTSFPRPLSKSEFFRPGVVGYRLREAYIDPEGKVSLAVVEAKLENGETQIMVGGNSFKKPDRSEAVKSLQLAPQNKRQMLLQKFTPSSAKPQTAPGK